MFFRLATAATAIALLPVAAANAKGDTVQIGGNATLNSTTGTTTSVALSPGAVAQTSTGSITRSHVGGSATTNASVGTQTALAAAPRSQAKILVGSIDGANTGGSARTNASASSVTAVTIMPGSTVCAAIGNVGAGGSNAGGHAGHVLVYNVGFARKARYRQGNSGAVC
jgi:hypothetical protein